MSELFREPYIARVYKGEKTFLDFLTAVERFIYKACGIDPKEEMDWKVFLKALLILNAFQFVTAATGMVPMAGVMKTMAAKSPWTEGVGRACRGR